MHSEMGPSVTKPNPENCKNCSSKCASVVHNTKQNSFDNLPFYLQANIIAQMLSVGGEGAQYPHLSTRGTNKLLASPTFGNRQLQKCSIVDFVAYAMMKGVHELNRSNSVLE